MASFKYLLLITLIIGFASCQNPKEEVPKKEFSISYEKFTLENGLEVILHKDTSDPMVAVASIFHVGSNREKPGKTGFAHFFEHMSFNDSENVPMGANRKLIPEWGGSRNGGTWSDGTIYYEVVPKDAFEKILWIDSDRMGFMINTVTQEALEAEIQVVKNEKRERNDNAPYGHTDEVIRKNLYPEGHPYSWTIIGSLKDLQSASLEDVKEFYREYYGARNATLVIAGDIDIEEAKQMVDKWFGEIRAGDPVESMGPMPVSLEATKALYWEDNFAKLPELRMVYPSVENYHADGYALEALGQLLSGSKNAPLYQVIVEEEKLAPNVGSYHDGNELAGEFVIRVRANAGTDLDDVKAAIENGMARFEQNGVNERDLKRIKAELETGLYQGVETVLNKAFQLAIDNEFYGDPGYIAEQAKLYQAVTTEDVMRVYNTYIKGKPYLMTSFVPAGMPELVVEGSELAEVEIEEVLADVAEEEVTRGDEAEYEKTVTKFDRSEPPFGPEATFTMPDIWTGEMGNGMKVYGIENNEIPLVSFDLTIKGGHWLDPLDKAGVSDLFADLMMEGTQSKTPAELEEAIGLLGSSISMNGNPEEIRIYGTCLSRNFEPTLALVEEILLQPRWDTVEYNRLKSALNTKLKGREANPIQIASVAFTRLMYGDEHIFGYPSSGTITSTENIDLDDLKAYYANLSPQLTSVHIAGDIDRETALKGLGSLEKNWTSEAPDFPSYAVPEQDKGGNLYFIDFPGAKQSVIFIGKATVSAGDPDFVKLDYANEKIGGGSSGQFFQILRIEKGYTYGAYSFFRNTNEIAPFIAYSNVRSNATKPSLEIFQDLLSNYADNFTEEDVITTQKKIQKSTLRSYESLGSKLGILRDISKYGKSNKYLEEDQETLRNMTLEDFKSTIETYLNESDMYYVVVGDAATQLEEVSQAGKGDPILLDINGNLIQ